jgi:RNA polymerase sigma-70 factor (ECF subfamily)
VESLFRAYAPQMGSIAFRLLRNDVDVDDVLQDVFAIASRKIHQIEDMEGARPWLATITIRTARAHLRRRRWSGWLGLGRAQASEQLTSFEASPADRTLLAQIFNVLDALPYNERVAWTLRYLEEESLESVALLCGCSLATAKRWIRRAEVRMDKRLNRGSI